MMQRNRAAKKLLIFLSVPAAVFLGTVFSAHAATVTWIAGAPGNWSTGANWSGGVAPTSTDTALFSSSSTQNVTIDTTVTIAALNITSGYTGTINASSATVTIGGDFTRSGGSFSAGGSTFMFNGSTTTLTGSSTFNNLTVWAGSSLDNNLTIATGTVITASGTLTLSGGGNIIFNGGELDAKGDITITNTGSGYTGGGDTSLVVNGTGNQTITGPGTVNQGALPNITVNKSSGTATFARMVTIRGNWTNTAGTLSFGTSTVAFRKLATLTGSSTFNNLTVTTIGSGVDTNLTIATGTIITASGTLTLSGSSNVTLNGGELDAKGDITITNSGISGGGNTSLVVNGTGNQTITGPGTADQGKLPNVTINKSSGLTFVSSTITLAGNLNVTAGEFRLASSTSATQFLIYGSVTVAVGGMLSSYSSASSTISLGSSFTNNGTVFFDGGGTWCVSPIPNYILIRSTVSGAQRSWSGSGTFIMRYTDVKDQAGTASISVVNGTNSGNNGLNWSFATAAKPQLVQSVTNNGGTGTTQLTLPFGFWPRAGDLIVVAVSARNQLTAAPTDTAGNNYYLIASSTFSSSPSYTLGLYYAKNVSTTYSFTVTANGTSSQAGSFLSATAFEYTGIAPSSTFDKYSINTDTSGNAVSLTSGSVTAGRQHELYFGAMTLSTGTTATSGSGWTARAGVTDNTSRQSLYTEDIATSTILTTAATWTSNASTSYAAILALFYSPFGANFQATGTLDSSIYDTGIASGVELNSVLWQGTKPAGTSVQFQFAVSNASSGPWNYAGPNGTSSTYFSGDPGVSIGLLGTVSGYSLFNGYRYFRYRVFLYSDLNQFYSPTVNDITVNWSP